MLKLLKNKVIILLLLLVAVVLGLIFFLRAKQPVPTSDSLVNLPSLDIQGKTLLAQPNTEKISETLNSLPNSTAVYQITPAKITHQQAIDQAVKFGLTGSPLISQDPTQGSIYIWQTSQNYLMVSTDKASITYGLDLLTSKEIIEGELDSEEEIQSAAISFLENGTITLPEQTQLFFQSIKLLKINGPQYREVTDINEAEVAEVNFGLKVNNLAVANDKGNTSLVKLIVGPEMKIVRLDYQMPFLAVSTADDYPITDKASFLETIKANPQILYYDRADYKIPEPFEYQNIKNIDFTLAKLAYYLPDKSSSYLQPVMIIEGEGTVDKTQFTSISVYPVIQGKYYLEEQ